MKRIGVVLVDEEMYSTKAGVFDVATIRYRNTIVFFKSVIQLYMYIHNCKRNLCLFSDASEKEEHIFKQYLIMIIETRILKVKNIYNCIHNQV